MNDKWIDDLIQKRKDKTEKEKQGQRLQEISEGDAPAAFKRFCVELESLVTAFNEKNLDEDLGRFRCEERGSSTIAVVRAVGNSDHVGQVTISLESKGPSLSILHQPGGPELSDRIQLQPQADGAVYFWRENKQISVAQAAQHVLSTFIMKW